MQQNKLLNNLSEETKQNNPVNESYSRNFKNSQSKAEPNNNETENVMKEEKNSDNVQQFILNQANNLIICENCKENNSFKSSPANNFHSPVNIQNSLQKIDNNLSDSFSFDNSNDDNFFNFSFYNNNKINNNKIINDNKMFEKNNYYENDNNSNNDKENNVQNDNLSKISTHINFPKPNINLNNPRNLGEHELCYENSNLNFRKKKHNKDFKVRFGDWICPKCENLNFSFRKKCNRCGLSKEKTEKNNNCNDNNQIQCENNMDQQRPIMLNNININYIFNSNYPLNNINIIYNPILFNISNINNYYGNHNNYNIYYPCNVNIKKK